jgi:hypothetical protein
MIHVVFGEEGRHRLIKVKGLVESAKWNMYAELWPNARIKLEEARHLAVSLRDRQVIDEILMLLSKCDEREKPEID